MTFPPPCKLLDFERILRKSIFVHGVGGWQFGSRGGRGGTWNLLFHASNEQHAQSKQRTFTQAVQMSDQLFQSTQSWSSTSTTIKNDKKGPNKSKHVPNYLNIFNSSITGNTK